MGEGGRRERERREEGEKGIGQRKVFASETDRLLISCWLPSHDGRDGGVGGDGEKE